MNYPSVEYCVCCGLEIPEGHQVCKECEAKMKAQHLIDRDSLLNNEDDFVSSNWGPAITTIDIANASIVPAIPIKVVRKYLLKTVEEWNKLGDRKYDLPNVQVYNHVRKCLDDLDAYTEALCGRT